MGSNQVSIVGVSTLVFYFGQTALSKIVCAKTHRYVTKSIWPAEDLVSFVERALP
jgi:hypothetical protein